MPPIQQPLLPVQHGSPGDKGRGGVRRPGSQHVSPAKELAAAVQQGDVEGALAAVSWACLRSPTLLLAAVALLLAAMGLAALLLPQQPLTGVLQHLPLRQAGPGRRAFFDELSREGQLLAARQPPSAKPPRRRQASREEVLDALIFSLPRGDNGGTAPSLPARRADEGGRSADGTGIGSPDDSGDGSDPMFDIHEVAKVPPLFGSSGRQAR